MKAASLNVRSGPGTSYQSLGRLSSGARVTVLSEQTGTDGQTWYNIRYTSSSGSEATGYVAAAYVQTAVTYTTDSDFEAYLNSQGFPESYKDGLRQLHASYPNWVFKAFDTGLDWEKMCIRDRRTAAKKAAEPKAEVHFQFDGKDLIAKDILDQALKAYKAGHKGVAVKKIELYRCV